MAGMGFSIDLLTISRVCFNYTLTKFNDRVFIAFYVDRCRDQEMIRCTCSRNKNKDLEKKFSPSSSRGFFTIGLSIDVTNNKL